MMKAASMMRLEYRNEHRLLSPIARLRRRVRWFYLSTRRDALLIVMVTLLSVGILHGARVYTEFVGNAILYVVHETVQDKAAARMAHIQLRPDDGEMAGLDEKARGLRVNPRAE